MEAKMQELNMYVQYLVSEGATFSDAFDLIYDIVFDLEDVVSSDYNSDYETDSDSESESDFYEVYSDEDDEIDLNMGSD